MLPIEYVINHRNKYDEKLIDLNEYAKHLRYVKSYLKPKDIIMLEERTKK